MSDTRAEIVRALAEALFPGLQQDAEMAQSANQEAIATFLMTSAAKMDFVIAAVIENMEKLTPENQKELALQAYTRSGPGDVKAAPKDGGTPPSEDGTRHSGSGAPRDAAVRVPPHVAFSAAVHAPAGGNPAVVAFKGLRSLILSTAFNATTAEGGNPLWPGIGFEGPDLERSQKPTQARLQAEAVLQQAVLHVGDAPCKEPQEFLEFVRGGIGKPFCSEASSPSIYLEGDRRNHPRDAVVIMADAVICGSGAGGGVAAALLAEAGAKAGPFPSSSSTL
ncbi:hypothetical protein CVIRNUC_000246 [Coccomyxa viridis]|uniref:Uncharacterized protein n=1 Tax=Coccomyxa viridis TaxID=1274662 RepID=A0AAV1HRA8_9CHLO|nr:hypothetical protein CVIRNUC_000246 [Coccomyxa viridis]